MIDHTFLKAFGSPQDVEKICNEARMYGFCTAMVNPAELDRVVRLVQGSDVLPATVIGFPLGQNTPPVKEFEAKDAIDRGAKEIDLVINVRALQAGDLHTVRTELGMLAQAGATNNVVSKVILETCYLTDPQKELACRIARDEGVGFVKTSTGFGSGGATVEDVRLMRRIVGEDMGVKASGGIRNLESAIAMIDAGATRLGTSAGVAIVEELKVREKDRS